MTTSFVAMQKTWSTAATLGHANMASTAPTADYVRKMHLYKMAFRMKIPKSPWISFRALNYCLSLYRQQLLLAQTVSDDRLATWMRGHPVHNESIRCASINLLYSNTRHNDRIWFVLLHFHQLHPCASAWAALNGRGARPDVFECRRSRCWNFLNFLCEDRMPHWSR